MREIQSDMAGQGECKRLAGQLQELRSAMERQDNDIMQLKDTMKQGMTSTHGDQERLQHQMEDGQHTQERLALRVGQVKESIHHDRQLLQPKHVAMESKVRGLEQLVQQANTASEEAHKSGQALTKRVDQMGREIYETQVRILTEQLGEERKWWDIRFGRLEEWLMDADKQRREQTSQDSARMDLFSDWIMKVERKTDLPTLAVGHMPQERSMDVERMIEIKLDACTQVAKKVEQLQRQINDDIQHGVRAREELAAQTKVSVEACTRSAANMDKQVKRCAREWETTCANTQEEVQNALGHVTTCKEIRRELQMELTTLREMKEHTAHGADDSRGTKGQWERAVQHLSNQIAEMRVTESTQTAELKTYVDQQVTETGRRL